MSRGERFEAGGYAIWVGAATHLFIGGFAFALAAAFLFAGIGMQWRASRARKRRAGIEVWVDAKRITDEAERLRVIDETRRKLR